LSFVILSVFPEKNSPLLAFSLFFLIFVFSLLEISGVPKGGLWKIRFWNFC